MADLPLAKAFVCVESPTNATRGAARAAHAGARAHPREASLAGAATPARRSEEHTSELQSQSNLVCRLLLEKKKSRRHPFEDRSGPDDRVLKVGPALTLECQRLVEVEGEHLVAGVLAHEREHGDDGDHSGQ